MANLSKTKTLFAFTSPRTIEKIIPEIRILAKNYEGKKWSGNSDLQISFFKDLFYSEFYQGNKMPSNVSLASRDRITRAPKSLGFIDLKPVIRLTDAGKLLLTEKRINETITRQLLKFQLPSPYHPINDKTFFVKPYLELLRLIREVGSLSKSEIALFFLQLTHYKHFSQIVSKIEIFRKNSKSFKGSRKTYVAVCFEKEIQHIYADEIKAKNFKTRESEAISMKKFFATKRSNMIDYADAFIRYLRATLLITFDKRTFHAIISPAKNKDVDFILNNVMRKPKIFNSEDDFKQYLFNPNSVMLLTDDRNHLFKRLNDLKISYYSNATIESLKDLLEDGESQIISSKIEETTVTLKNYKKYNDIVDIFRRISNREVPDPPLYLEWNVWRALVMMNYAKEIKGNFRIDLDGVPLSTAGGNIPDIEVLFNGFKVIVEVTMSSGSKQYEMEGEPVARHFGSIQKLSSKPVYCLFIAPTINENSLAHFFNLNRFYTKAYGGKTKIIPLSIKQFIIFITVAKKKGFNNPNVLKQFFDKIVKENQTIEDEEAWINSINEKIPFWVG
ncbi:MAG: hypothetical protein B6D61_13905 [Bacteroidetes bacterium 4484_249]|nr:MAG: hypothetical protein B6D61_13905 [Bacteroidetes bacterium 4484_249]